MAFLRAHSGLVFILAALCIFLSSPPDLNAQVDYSFYSIHVASYKDFDYVADAVNSLKKQGYDSFSMTVNISGKGTWCRVFVGKYKSPESAFSDGQALKEKRVIDYFKVLKIEQSGAGKKSMPLLHEVKLKQEPAVESEKKSDLHKTITVSLDTPEAKKKLPAISVRKSYSLSRQGTKPDHKTRPAAEAAKKGIVSSPEMTTRQTLEKDDLPSDKISEDKTPDAEQEKQETLSTYARAMDDFKAGRYKDASYKFLKVIGSKPSEIEKEVARRHIADCNFFIAEESGEIGYFLKAVNGYKKILADYPLSKKKNLSASYRLAESYRRSNRYPEAIKQLKRFCSDYSESDYIPEALYNMGEMYRKIKMFKEAVEELKKYVKRFPDGKHVRDACFRIGNCYSQMRQFNDADKWYQKALEKCPSLEDIPKEILSQLGSHYFLTGRYDDALKSYIVYVNLFPEGDEKYKAAFYAIARCVLGVEQPALAVKMLDRLIERFPESREAQESAVIMANIGVRMPELKVPKHIFPWMDYYHDPIGTYDKMMTAFGTRTMKDGLLFQRGYGLMVKGRYKDAFNTYRYLLDHFPDGSYVTASKKNLVSCGSKLIDEHYSRKDYAAVLAIYFDFPKDILFKSGDFNVLFKIGNSLKKTNQLDAAAEVFKKMTDIFASHEKITDVLFAAVEADYDRGDYDSAEKNLAEFFKRPVTEDGDILIMARILRADICYRKGNFEKAAYFYSEVLGSDKKAGDRAPVIYKKYADSMKSMGMHSSAIVNYKRAIEKCSAEKQNCDASVIAGSYAGLGDGLYHNGRYPDAIAMYEQALGYSDENEQKAWAMFNISRGYMGLGDRHMANKFLYSLKEEGENEFWSSVADYYIYDNEWTDRYSRYLSVQ